MEDEQAGQADRRHQRAEHGRQRQVAAADPHRQRDAVRPRAVGLAVAQHADRHVRDEEGEHRAERVDADEELEVARDDERRGEHGGQHDDDVRRPLAGVQASHRAGDLPVARQRVRQPRQPEHRAVRRDDERDRGQRGDDVAQRVGQPRRVERRHERETGALSASPVSGDAPGVIGSEATATSEIPT